MAKSNFIFNSIAPVYGLFFDHQVRTYRALFDNHKPDFDPYYYCNAIDIGSGTGALCKVLQEHHLEVTGAEPAKAMLAVAKKKTGVKESENPEITFIQADALEGLPYSDKSFDFAITSYVAHGLIPDDRMALYEEMERVSKHAVILLDYNERRSIVTNIVEWIEGGNYFSFIRYGRAELEAHFQNIKVVNTGNRSAMYICEIK